MARPKGSTNKNSTAVKDMIRAALERKGGVAYFEKQADENPVAFMSLIGKTIPADVRNHVTLSFFDKYADEE